MKKDNQIGEIIIYEGDNGQPMVEKVVQHQRRTVRCFVRRTTEQKEIGNREKCGV